MDVLNFGAHLIGNILMIGFHLNCWLHFGNVTKKKARKILIILLSSIFTTIISQFFPNPIKMFNSFLILIFTCYLSVNKDLKTSILSVITTQLILWIPECSFTILVQIFNIQNAEALISNPAIYLLLIVAILLHP